MSSLSFTAGYTGASVMSYSCSHCGLQYSRLWSLNRHLRKCFKFYQPSDAVSSEQSDSSSDEKETQNLQQGRGVKRQRAESFSQDQELKTKQSEDEDSEIGGQDELTQNVNIESEAETSESEDEEEELTMDEENKQETSINWPVSRTYRIKYPWSFWGEIPNIKKNIRWLERLQDVEHPTVIYNIQNASPTQLATLCEIAYNCVRGHIPLERWNWKELRKHRRAVRLLANSDVDIEEKREELLRRGADFVETLLYTINPLILFNVPRTLEIAIPQEDESVEEMVDEY